MTRVVSMRAMPGVLLMAGVFRVRCRSRMPFMLRVLMTRICIMRHVLLPRRGVLAVHHGLIVHAALGHVVPGVCLVTAMLCCLRCALFV